MPFALILALAASLGLHAAALFGPDIDLAPEPEPPTLQAELKPTPKALLAPTPPPSPARKVVRRKSTVTGHSSAPSVSPVLTAPDSEAVPSAVEAGAGQPAVENTLAAETVAAEAPALPYFPTSGQILYRVDRGDSGFEIGRANSSWELNDGDYELRLHTETTGIVWLFKSYRIDMESRGRLTPEGLRPERFSIRRNGQASSEAASFDWQQMQVRVGEREPQALDAGAQDLLSFNFHLGFMQDPHVARTLSIATGKKYAQYRLEAVGDEEIELPFGKLHTLHLKAPGDNTTELWLAYDYLLLPVKIRHEDSKGGSFVQVAIDIRVAPPKTE